MSPGQATAQAFRNLSPTTIVCDEIAQRTEAEAILEGRRASTRIIATSHGRLQDLVAKREINAVLGNIKESTVSDETQASDLPARKLSTTQTWRVTLLATVKVTATTHYESARRHSFSLTLDDFARANRFSVEPHMVPSRVWRTDHIWADGLRWVSPHSGDGGQVLHKGRHTSVFSVRLSQLQARRTRLRAEEQARKVTDAREREKDDRSRSPHAGRKDGGGNGPSGAGSSSKGSAAKDAMSCELTLVTVMTLPVICDWPAAQMQWPNDSTGASTGHANNSVLRTGLALLTQLLRSTATARRYLTPEASSKETFLSATLAPLRSKKNNTDWENHKANREVRISRRPAKILVVPLAPDDTLLSSDAPPVTINVEGQGLCMRKRRRDGELLLQSGDFAYALRKKSRKGEEHWDHTTQKNKQAKLFVAAEWIAELTAENRDVDEKCDEDGENQNPAEANNTEETTGEDGLTSVPSTLALPILIVPDDCKFTNPDKSIIEIEMRGERRWDEVLIYSGDVAEKKMQQLPWRLTRDVRPPSSGFTEDIHYRILFRNDRNALFFTYMEFTRFMHVSHSPFAEHFCCQAARIVFVMTMGGDDDRENLAVEVFGLANVRRILQRHGPKNCAAVYLITLGTVKELRSSMGITTSGLQDDSIVAKYGMTTNIEARLYQHLAHFGKILHVEPRFKKTIVLDPTEASTCEVAVKRFFEMQQNWTLQFSATEILKTGHQRTIYGRTEVVTIPSACMKTIVE
ncbi:hypothetical protein HKX48_002998 [Thoreauomyces humboldtii]|nr:hypothetical protein HKX48_002998 [Thoreauomyces humboldtii]